MHKTLQENKHGYSDLCRPDGRSAHQLRPLKITYDSFGYADSSVLFEIGNTKVLCCVTLQQGVPPFLRGKQTGWLSAEYAMLPTATAMRKQRDNSIAKPNGRSVEISRLIGRCLRSIVDVSCIGERTITVDCDVLQADGGTRTACISGAYIALKRAVTCWVESGLIASDVVILRDEIAAISVGVAGQNVLLDLDYAEDSTIDADFNFIMTKQGSLVEVQGTAEKQPICAGKFQEVCAVATKGVSMICAFFESAQQCTNSGAYVSANDQDAYAIKVHAHEPKKHDAKTKAPLFSLQNRLQNYTE